MKSRSLKQDLGLKVASLVLSLLLWLHVQGQKNHEAEERINLKVAPTSVPENLVPVGEEPRVELTLVGPPEVIETFRRQGRGKNLRAFADVSSAEEAGAREFAVDIEPKSELSGLRFKDNKRPNALFEFEERSEVVFPVEVVTGGDPPAGFEFGSASINPSQIRLIGPKSRMERVGSVRTLISLTSIQPGGTLTAPIEVLDKRGNAITSLFRVIPSSVDVTPALSPAQPRRSLLVSPRYAGALAPGLQLVRVSVTPSELRVQGDRSRIAGQSILETEPIDLSAITRTQTVTVRVKLPAGIRLEKARGDSSQEVRVTLSIQTIAISPNPPPAP